MSLRSFLLMVLLLSVATLNLLVGLFTHNPYFVAAGVAFVVSAVSFGFYWILLGWIAILVAGILLATQFL